MKSKDCIDPPRLARKLLQWFCNPLFYEDIAGDLEELYHERRKERGRRGADWRYWRDVIWLFRPVLMRKISMFFGLKLNTIMYNNYFKIALRNMLKQKGYATINVMGLAIGMACCFIIYLYVAHELSYDRFHEKSNRIYRVAFSTDEDGQPTNANGSFGVAPAMKRDLPEIQEAVRVRKMGQGTKVMVGHEDLRFYEEDFFFADSSIFSVFDFPFMAGDPETALTAPNTMVISESAAYKYFETTDVLGNILEADPYNSGEIIPFKITGILKEIPRNAHFPIDFLASFTTQSGNLENWFGFNQVFTYVLLHSNNRLSTFQEKVFHFSEKYLGEDPWYRLSLQPLTSIYLHSDLKSEIAPTSSQAKVNIFTAIGIIIMLIACINFLTLSTARSIKRAREVGVRKTLGAFKRQLVVQFYLEAFLYSLLATLVAVLLITLVMPQFNAFTGKDIRLWDGQYLWARCLTGAGLLMLITLVAGSYPAVYLSSFKPIAVLKGKSSGRVSLNAFRKLLVILQFIIFIVLIISTLIVLKQMDFVRQKALEAQGDQIMVLPLTNEIRTRLPQVKQAIEQLPGVVITGSSTVVPTRGSSSNCFEISDERDRICSFIFMTDPDYVNAMGYKVIAGRMPSRDIQSDLQGTVVITRKMAENTGLTDFNDLIGVPMFIEGREAKIIGVIEDFHNYSLHVPVSAAMIAVFSDRNFQNQYTQFDYLVVRLQTKGLSQTMAGIKETWHQYATKYPFDYFFMDESFEALHRSDIKTGRVLAIFTVLAVFIAIIGLVGLSSYTAEQRQPEMGIRKLLGASMVELIKHLSGSYFKLVTIAYAISCPLAWWTMQFWLDNFAYKTTIGWGIFVLAGIFTLIFVVISISYQTFRTARLNPVDTIRKE